VGAWGVAFTHLWSDTESLATPQHKKPAYRETNTMLLLSGQQQRETVKVTEETNTTYTLNGTVIFIKFCTTFFGFPYSTLFRWLRA
jgi:hypothetical protein